MSGQTDISGFGTQGSQITTGTTDIGATPQTGTAGPNTNVSTLSPSELKKLEEALFLAAFPFLQPPNNSIITYQDPGKSDGAGPVTNATVITSFSMQIDQMSHDIIMDMWEKFAKTLDEIAKRRVEEDKKKWGEDADKAGPKSAGEYNAYLLSLTTTQRAAETGPTGDSGLNLQFKSSYDQWIANPVTSGAINPTGGFPDASFLRGAVASSPDVVSQTIGTVDTATGVQLSVSPVADALFALGPVSALPADTQLAAAMIAALLYNGAANKANNDALADASRQSQPVATLDFAINYAKNILAIVTHEAKGGEGSNGQNRLIKLMLATMALTLLHRGVFKGAAAEDIESLIRSNGADIEKSDIPADIKELFKNLAVTVNELLNEDPATREAMIAQMAQYADTKDPAESMVKSTKLLSAMLDTSVDGKILEAKQG